MTILYSTTLIISSILYLIIQKYFIRKGIYDKVKDRSSHKVSATRSGGASIFATLFIITSILLTILSREQIPTTSVLEEVEQKERSSEPEIPKTD